MRQVPAGSSLNFGPKYVWNRLRPIQIQTDLSVTVCGGEREVLMVVLHTGTSCYPATLFTTAPLQQLCEAMAAASEPPSPAHELQSRPQQHAPPLLSIWGLSCRTQAGVPIVEGLSVELPAAGALLVEGPSACGKSTLLQVLAGLRPSFRGNFALPPQEQVTTSFDSIFGGPCSKILIVIV